MKKLFFLILGVLAIAASSNSFATCPTPLFRNFCVQDGTGHTSIVSLDTCTNPNYTLATCIGSADIRMCAGGQWQCPDPRTRNCDRDGNCPQITDAETFDFNIESGGWGADVYVCQVGLRLHTCPDCDTDGLDKINVYDKDNKFLHTLTKANPTHTYGPFDYAHHADVFLNTAEYGSGWYVRYCLNLIHGWAGGTVDGIPGSTSLSDSTKILLNGSVTLTPGYYDTYQTEAGLSYSVKYGCGESLTQITDFGDDGGNANLRWDEITNHAESLTYDLVSCVNEEGSNGCAPVTNACRWEVHFQETKRCPRRLKDLDISHCPIKNGAYECTLHTGTISTQVTANVTPTCLDCAH